MYNLRDQDAFAVLHYVLKDTSYMLNTYTK